VSAPLGVLEVMRRCRLHLPDEKAGDNAYRCALAEASAQVEELVDASARYLHAVTYPVGDGKDAGRIERNGARLSRAIAAVTP